MLMGTLNGLRIEVLAPSFSVVRGLKRVAVPDLLRLIAAGNADALIDGIDGDPAHFAWDILRL